MFCMMAGTRAVTAVLLSAAAVRGCTIVAVGRRATADGSVLVSHSEDAEGAGDPRPRRIKADKHKKGSHREVLATDVSYPRNKRVLGKIPQVEHTYAYMQTTYGMINEKQVIMGESTASSISPIGHVKPKDKGGNAIFGIQTLSELGLERCDSARCAVKTMGELAEKYGFYQDDGTPSGEAMAVGDPKELFIFNILPDSTGKSAVWAAARVPDDHVAVIANMFTIQELHLDQPTDFLASKNIEQEAERSGNWKKGKPLEFTKVFSAGEYGKKYYAGRRVWRGYQILAPDVHLEPEYNDLKLDAPYPLSVQGSGITPAHVFKVHRDYYKGTPYDLTKGLLAGPWGTPNRYLLHDSSPLAASFERPISIYRTMFSYVAQAREWLPDECGATLWYGPHTAHGTVYQPVVMGLEELPRELSHFDLDKLDRHGAFWAFVAIQSLAEARFAWIAAEVEAMQEVLENGLFEVQAKADEEYKKKKHPKVLKEAYHAAAKNTTGRMWALFEQLVMRYADGFIRGPKPEREPAYLGYPKEWLTAAGYSGQLPDKETSLLPPATPLLASLPKPKFFLEQTQMLAATETPPTAEPQPQLLAATETPPTAEAQPAAGGSSYLGLLGGFAAGIVTGAVGALLVVARSRWAKQEAMGGAADYQCWEPAAEEGVSGH